jgi:hypothetical protein
MSQKLVANPTPQAASTALANTTASVPELANRREIPLTAFDFLNGAYNAAKRARLFTLALIAAVLLAGVYISAAALVDSFQVGDVEQQLSSLEAERAGLLTEFGNEINGVSTQVVLDRDRSLSSGLAAVTAAQGDVVSVINEISGLVNSRASIIRVSYGIAPAGDKSKQTTTTTTTPGATATKSVNAVAFTIVIRGIDIAAAADMAERIRQLPSLQNVEVDVQGREVLVNATLPLNKPPRAMLERLIGLGVRTSAAATTTTGESTTTTVAGGN